MRAIAPKGTINALQTGQSARTMSANVWIKLDEFSHQTGSEYEAAVGTNSVLGLLRAAGTKPSSQIERNSFPGRESLFQGSSLKLRSDGTAEQGARRQTPELSRGGVYEFCGAIRTMH